MGRRYVERKVCVAVEYYREEDGEEVCVALGREAASELVS